jgi:hypothetical protein
MAAERWPTGGSAPPDGLVGPVLVLADAEAIGRLAPAWAAAFAAAGLEYRVRLVSGAAGEREIVALAGELRRQGARSCAVAGAAGAVATARAVAAGAGVPCVDLDGRPPPSRDG